MNEVWRRRSGAGFENRPTSADLPDLLGIEQCAAKVDQIEIHILNARAAEIGAAKVGLADFFGALEVLFAPVVGVESGAASLAGDRAADEAAAG